MTEERYIINMTFHKLKNVSLYSLNVLLNSCYFYYIDTITKTAARCVINMVSPARRSLHEFFL